MSDRSQRQAALLAAWGWDSADFCRFAGDASARRYARLTTAEANTAILMEVPLSDTPSLAKFCQIADYLRAIGLSAPEIYHRADKDGFMLLEDFGDGLLSSVLEVSPDAELTHYLRVTDLLLHLHTMPPPEGLLPYGPFEMADFTGVLFDRYVAPLTGSDMTKDKKAAEKLIYTALRDHAPQTDVVILRDFHADNIIVLPDRTGLLALGLLDFQDALLGHPAYDLVSLLEDVRRNVSEETKLACIAHYIRETGVDSTAFRRAFAVQGAQRNMRILGVFANLALSHNKPQYIDLMPAVWSHLMNNLESSVLSDLRSCILDSVPEPTPEALNRLKDLCLTP